MNKMKKHDANASVWKTGNKLSFTKEVFLINFIISRRLTPLFFNALLAGLGICWLYLLQRDTIALK